LVSFDGSGENTKLAKNMGGVVKESLDEKLKVNLSSISTSVFKNGKLVKIMVKPVPFSSERAREILEAKAVKFGTQVSDLMKPEEVAYVKAVWNEIAKKGNYNFHSALEAIGKGIAESLDEAGTMWNLWDKKNGKWSKVNKRPGSMKDMEKIQSDFEKSGNKTDNFQVFTVDYTPESLDEAYALYSFAKHI